MYLIYFLTLWIMFNMKDIGILSAYLHEFQFHCYATGLCTFPTQFCSSASKRCNECKYECDSPEGKFPLACKTFCDKLHHEGKGETEDGLSWQEQPVWFYTSIVGFLAIIVLLVLCIKFGRNIIDYLRQRCRRDETKPDSILPENVPLNQDCGDGAESGVESMSSRDDVNQAPKGYGKGRKFPEALQNISPTGGGSIPPVMATSHSKAAEQNKDPLSSMIGSVKASGMDPYPQLVTSVSMSPEEECSRTEDFSGDQTLDAQRNTSTTSGETSVATELKHISMPPSETRRSNMVGETTIEMDSVQSESGIGTMTSAAVP